MSSQSTKLKWVSDIIGTSFTEWQCGDIIMITAQTGTGKTHFILHQYLEYVASKNEKILYLCNRGTLAEQLRQSLKGRSENIKSHIIVQTYQYVESLSYSRVIKNNNISHCIYDEAHYFYQDALFNSGTGRIFDFLTSARLKPEFQQARHIFMSATDDYMYALIGLHYYGYGNLQNFENYIASFPSEKEKIRQNVKHYSTNTDYRYLKPYYFEDYSEIVKQIQNSPANEKWLIFVGRIDNGMELQAKLKALLNGNVALLTKNSKNGGGATYQNIIQNAKFDERVLLATSVLDNGVNIHDHQLKHLVVPANLQTQTLQMIGRKRINIEAPDTLNLYIQVFSSQIVNGLLHKNLECLNFINLFSSRPSKSLDNAPFCSLSLNDKISIRKKQSETNCEIGRQLKKEHLVRLLTVNRRENADRGQFLADLQVNPLARFKLYWENNELNIIKNALKEGFAGCMKKQLKWLNLEYDEANWLSYQEKKTADQNLLEFLRKNMQKEIGKQQQNQFREKCSRLLLVCHKKQELGQNFPLGKAKLNEAFVRYQIPYKIESYTKSRKTMWRIVTQDLTTLKSQQTLESATELPIKKPECFEEYRPKFTAKLIHTVITEEDKD